ncbi:MAG: phytanoyl-CoA dioxygenase family protein [Halioglobus sp.]
MTDALPHVPATAPEAEIVSALETFGGVIIEDFLGPETVARLNAELDQVMASEAGKERLFPNDDIASFFGSEVSHVSGVAGKSQVFVDELLCHPGYMSLCDHFLKPLCSDYQLNIAHVLQRGPGSEAQLLHRDAWVWKRLPSSLGEIQLASIVALCDFTADNGATLIVPGSHKWDDDRYPDMSETVAAAMPAGSAVVYLGNTFHGGGANVTAHEQRRGMHISYTVGWLRTEENQCLATPMDRVRTMPTRAQQLLGFGAHDDIEVGGGYLGTVELAPPHALLRADRL